MFPVNTTELFLFVVKRGLDKMTFRGPFQPQSFCDIYTSEQGK